MDREVVGLFVASSVVPLAALVDECCDPNDCEYALAQAGGLMAAGVTAAKWPRDPGASEEVTGLEGAVLSQQWQNDLGDGGLEWKPLGPAGRQLLRSLGRNR